MFRKIWNRFSVTLRTSTGHKFNGEFGDPNAYPRPRKEVQNLPHRALVTSRKALAEAGDLVSFNGVQYLLCGQHTLTETKRFLAIEVNATVRWTRIGEVIDPVTKMKKDDAEVVLDPALPVTWEPQRAVEEVHFAQSQRRLFTSADVQEGDELDGLRVLRLDDLFGIKVVEVA